MPHPAVSGLRSVRLRCMFILWTEEGRSTPGSTAKCVVQQCRQQQEPAASTQPGSMQG
jgi:hypothetical protein